MTDLTSNSIDNGARQLVKFTGFEGMAGVVADETGGELAFLGDRFADYKPGAGTVGDKAVTISDIRRSATARKFVVAKFTFVTEAA
jgi:hypothetical protein